jgi:hypothetical protein
MDPDPTATRWEDATQWAGIIPRPGTVEPFDDLGALFTVECAASIAYRYPNDPPEAAEPFKYRIPRQQPTIVEAFKIFDCYEYQSCEHPGWKTSRAAEICRKVKDTLIAKLPGYEAAPWGWDHR